MMRSFVRWMPSVLLIIVLCPASVHAAESEPRAAHPLDDQLTHFSTMIVVRDLDASETFYRKHFGFSTEQRLEHLRLLRRPGISLYLITESPPTKDKPAVTLTPPTDAARQSVNLIFHVKDVRGAYARLKASGLTFLTPPQQPAWGGWRVFAQDPDGYLIEIEQAE